MAEFTVARAKRAAERFRIEADFKPLIEVGDTIASNAVTVTDLQTGEDTTIAMVPGVTVVGLKLRPTIQGGLDGHDYLILIRATTLAGDIFFSDALLPVRG